MSFRCDWCYNPLHQLGHGTAPLTLEFDHWIGTLYRAGAKVRPEHFRRQALEGLRQWIPFDGALWGNGTLETLSFHTFDSINLPDGLADALEQTRHLLDSDRQRLRDWEGELERSKPALTEFRAQARLASEALSAADTAMQQWSQNWDGFNDRAREPSQAAEVQQSRIAYLEQVLTKLQERSQQHQAELETLLQ